jgi:putative transcriptional regulator
LNYESIGNNIRAYRIRRHLRQEDLAEKTGIRQPTISAICTGSIKEMPVGVVNKICATLNCQPGDIMEYIPDEE